MKAVPIQALIQKYLTGKCTPEEKLEVETWYHAAEEDVDILEFLSDAERQMLRDILFKDIRRKISEKTTITSIASKRSVWVRYAVGVAALLVLGLGLAWVLVFSGRQSANEGLWKSDQTVELLNSEKHIRRVVLPDGSVAWIHPNSSLSYPARFHKEERTLTLTGEAFFEVTKDSLRPFVVHSGDVLTRVLGTSFRIKSLSSDLYTTISVATGKVFVSRIAGELPGPERSPDDTDLTEMVLTPDQSAVYSVAEKSFRKEANDMVPEMAMWKKSELSFDNAPVHEVLNKLNAVYDVQIMVSEKGLESYKLRADFTGMNLPDALEILGHSLGLTYEMENRRITLKKNSPE